MIQAFGRVLTPKDCTDEQVARWVCVQYLQIWGSHYKKVTGKKATNEVLARIWNGGPNGWKKKSTLGYLVKYRKLL